MAITPNNPLHGLPNPNDFWDLFDEWVAEGSVANRMIEEELSKIMEEYELALSSIPTDQ